MFTKILIANRGEIACRIIKTAKRLGISTVAVYSEVDQNALHVKLADEAHCIGPAPAQYSYLNNEKIIQAALEAGAQAIHPGYGFLSENAIFAEQCQQAKLIFIGPSPQAIPAMGSKSAAKRIMENAQVPLIPGYHNDDQSITALAQAAEKIGYPVLLKATAGGGGKGMRKVSSANELAGAVAAAKREALASFGNDQLLLEKYFIDPRHVEIQIFADQQGNTVYLFERDCSIQRRHQKIIEEAPAPHFSASLRKAMGEAAVAAAKAIQYTGAGTIEFLLAEQRFYFMEMNTRLQVEHPITEMITGLDLVEWQLRVAAGETLPLQQKQLKINGHAFEARIYAENPQKDFLPSIGTIAYLKTPAESAEVRLDSGVRQGDRVSSHYDPMLAKLIVWGTDRTAALARLTTALGEFQLAGIHTNLELLANISRHPAFKKGLVHTGFISQYQSELIYSPSLTTEIVLLATLFILLRQQSAADTSSPWRDTPGWQLNLPAQQQLIFSYAGKKIASQVNYADNHYLIAINQQLFKVKGHLQQSTVLQAEINIQRYTANIYIEQSVLYILASGNYYQLNYLNTDNIEFSALSPEHKTSLTAPMPGKIVALNAQTGTCIKAGEALAIIEAMKMEHTLHAPYTGIVKEWYFTVGDLVNEGVELLAFEEVKDK